MAVIGQINTIVSATTKPLTGALNRASGAFTSFGGRIKGMIGGLGRLGGALVGVAGAAGFGMMIKSSFDTIDSLAKTADAIGVSTEALAGLRRAGERSGVASDKLDKGLLRMQRSVSAAADGSALARDNFAKLGVSLDHIRSLSPEEQFIQVADAISKLPDQTDRTRIAMETFGRDGAAMLKLVEGGAQSARDELAKAAELGLAPSREDAAKIEAANDAIADMKDAFVGVANTVAINIAPSFVSIAGNIQALGQRVNSFVSTVSPLIRQVGSVFMTVFSQAWQTVKTVFDLIGISGKSTFGSIVDSAINFMIGVEFAFKNVGPIAELAWEKIKLGALTLWEDTKFLFTTQLPEAIAWFADNAVDIFINLWKNTITGFQNLATNIQSVWQGVLDFFAGKGFSVDWTPLTEGFVDVVKELPDISTRELTDVEKQMQKRVDMLGGNLATGLEEFTKKRRAELLPPEQKVEVTPEATENLADTLSESVTSGIKGAAEGPAAVQRGSAEAFSAILAAQRNANNPMAQVAKQGEKQISLQQQQLSALKQIERKGLDIELVGGEV